MLNRIKCTVSEEKGKPGRRRAALGWSQASREWHWTRMGAAFDSDSTWMAAEPPAAPGAEQAAQLSRIDKWLSMGNSAGDWQATYEKAGEPPAAPCAEQELQEPRLLSNSNPSR